MTSRAELTSARAAALARAHRRLLEKHLLQAEDDAVSVLLPGASAMLYRARDDQSARELPLTGLHGPPALHGRAYELRSDAGALASLGTATSAALARNAVHVPIVFDEQARHVGETWAPSDFSRLSQALSAGGNAGLVDGRFLILGVTPNRMIFNAELFEKCAGAYLLARGDAPGRKVHLVPAWVRWIAKRRLARDQARAARCHATGREAPELTAY
jgi:hypothetical protein